MATEFLTGTRERDYDLSLTITGEVVDTEIDDDRLNVNCRRS